MAVGKIIISSNLKVLREVIGQRNAYFINNFENVFEWKRKSNLSKIIIKNLIMSKNNLILSNLIILKSRKILMIIVSVIIPYFKKKNFIKKTLNSLKKQTYKNLEIIIIYDDENLSDLKFIKKFKKLDKRIKIIVNKKSQGAGRSRNIGMNIAKGKFIAFLDADDLWKNKLNYS